MRRSDQKPSEQLWTGNRKGRDLGADRARGYLM